MRNRILALSGLFCVTSLAAIAGCAEEEEGQKEQCIFVHSPKECDSPQAAEGNDGVGDGDAPHEPSCAAEPDGIERTVFQCNGRLSATIQFQTLVGDCKKILGNSKACQDSHEFGVGVDPYDMPTVMACCHAQGVPQDDVLIYCAADVVDQVCRSIPMRMQKLIDGGWLDGPGKKLLKKEVKKQAQALQDWLESNTQKCREALLRHSDVPGTLEPRSLKVPNSNKWNLLNDFTITVGEAVVESTTLPENQAEYLPCSDAHLNDTEIFEAKLPLFAGHHVDAPLIAGAGRSIAVALSHADDDVYVSSSLLVGGQPVMGVGAVDLACKQPRCSSLVVAEHAGPGLLALEELEIFADGSLTLSHGPLPVDLDGAALRLYGASPAEQIRIDGASLPVYIIAPHAAHFVISGAVGEHKDVRWGVNHSWIVIFVDVAEVRVEGFSVTHVDGSGESWIVSVPATTWK